MDDLFGGDQETTQTQSSEPWGVIQPYLKDVFSRAQDLSQQPGEYFPGQTYAGFDPLQEQGLQSQLGYADQLGAMLPGYQTASQQMLSAADVANNPYVTGMAENIQDQLNRNLMENLLPSIRSTSIHAGQPGGSRSDIARGVAARGTQEAIGSALTDLYGDAYGRGLTAQTNALSMAPQTLGLGMMPGQIQSQVGSQYQMMDQAGIDEEMQRYQYEQERPWDVLSRYNALLSGGGLPFGTTTGTTKQSGGGGMLGNLLGTGLSVAGLMTGNPFMSMGGMFSSPAPVGTARSFGYGSVPGFG